MQNPLRHPRRWPVDLEVSPGEGNANSFLPIPPLLTVLLRRWRIMAVTVLACLLCAALYLATATRMYRTAATIDVQQVEPNVLGNQRTAANRSEGFLSTQASLLRSTSVLSRAVNGLGHQSMQTFDGVSDPLAWLQGPDCIDVSTGNKSDLLVVSMDSPYPQEATQIVNAILRGYLEELAARRRTVGADTVKILQSERESLQRRRDAALREIAQHQQDRGVVSFRSNDNGNVVLQRTTALAQALTTAEIATFELRAHRESLLAALKDFQSIASYAEAMQLKAGENGGDREYDELRTQLVQHMLAVSSNARSEGENHPRLRMYQARVDALKERLAAKQRSMVDAQLVRTTAELTAAEDRERQLRAALRGQHDQALQMTPDAMRVASLEADVAQMQKQYDVLESRIAEVSANSLAGGPLNVQVVEWARAGKSPVKPRKGLTLIAAMVGGWVLAVGFALLREWHDRRLHTPEEVAPLLGMSIIAEIPSLNRQLSPIVRGQVVHLDPRSPAAGAYRAIRTNLTLGEGRESRTILVASPAPGDGKSTTASNLAISFANAGHRTLLIDCDLVRPVQHLIFETEHDTGLSSVWAGESSLRDAIHPTAIERLHLLPCGPIPAHPSDLLTSKRFVLLLKALLGAFDRIVIDSPPLTVADAQVLAASVDSTLLVLRMHHSRRDLTNQAVEGLTRVGANLIGVVANDVPATRGYRRYAYLGVGLDAACAERQMLVRKHQPVPRPHEQQEALAAIVEPDWTKSG